ncbi:hypothetical protein KR009_002059, partial [Drosophila setifemur]
NVRFPLAKHELETLEKKLQRIVFIQQTDAKYHRALADMRDQDSLSVLAEPSFYGRHQATSILVVATANESYVFDIRALGAIFPEMGKLLQAEQPRKVLHYSHRIADHLEHQHRIRLGGVCDSFVALCLARRERSPCSLPEAISMVFGLPLEDLLCEEVCGVRESRRNFTGRPLTENQLRYLAKMAILQKKMHDRLVYGSICAEMQRMSLNFSRNFSAFRMSSEAALNMAPSSRFGFDSINQISKTTCQGLTLP